MIRLHQYPPVGTLTSLSPFCTKVELFLRANGLKFETVTEWNPRRGPKGKMPFIEHEGKVIADSTFILAYLRETFGIDDKLSAAQTATAHAYQRLLEENLYWVILYARWGDPVGWKYVLSQFSPFFPWRMGPFVLRLIRRNLLRQLWLQGIGRHSPDEIYRIGDEDLQSLSDFLADRKYFLGERWTSVDATAQAFLKLIDDMPYENALRQSLRARSNLVKYVSLIPDRAGPEKPGKIPRAPTAESAKPLL